MSETQTPIPVSPTNTGTAIMPLKNSNQLPPLFDNSASISPTPVLEYACSVMIPVEVSWGDVTVFQYYGGGSTLDIYFVYDYPGTLSGDNQQYDVCVTALDKDISGQTIPLASIAEIFSLVQNKDPKTSRGTMTTVKPTT